MNKRTFLELIKSSTKIVFEFSKYYLVSCILINIINNILPIYILNLEKNLINGMVTNKSFNGIVFFLILYLLFNSLGEFFSQLDSYLTTIYQKQFGYQINQKIIKKINKIPIDFFDTPKYLDILKSVQFNSYSIMSVILMSVSLLGNIISLSIVFFIICKYNYLYALILLVVSIPSAIINKYYSSKGFEWHINTLKEERKLNYVHSLYQEKKFSQELKLYNYSGFFIKKCEKIQEYCLLGFKKIYKTKLAYLSITNLIPDLCIFLFLFNMIFYLKNYSLDVGNFVFYSGLFFSLKSKVSVIILNISAVYEDKLRLNTIFDFFDIEEELSDNTIIAGKSLKSIDTIEFKSVYFKYGESEKFVIEDLNFKIKKGEKVCILGINGSGKSTIVKLLLRFYRTTKGKILINGVDINEYDIRNLRSMFSVYFQVQPNYAISIKENIMLTNMDGDVKKFHFILNFLMLKIYLISLITVSTLNSISYSIQKDMSHLLVRNKN